MEIFVISLFLAVLLACLFLHLPILLALAAGYLIFFVYGLKQKCTVPQLLRMSLRGVKTVRNVLLLFFFIGVLTALWRASGTISTIVYDCAGLVHPSLMVLMVFLLNVLVSFLTGTSFGTLATMGVISVTMAFSMGVHPALAGGAMLAGIFFGDRCSPVSTSALLCAELTGTDIYRNIPAMVKTSLVPFVLSCVVYALLGLLPAQEAAQSADLRPLLAEEFRLGFVPLLPALLVVVLAALKVEVKKTISLSILAAAVVCLFYQHTAPRLVLRFALTGYVCENPALASVMNGGGLFSMLEAALIVCISSCYAGIFEDTGLLEGLSRKIQAFSERFTPFAATLLVASVTAAVSCNQTLSILLTDQLCSPLNPDKQKFAVDLEDTAVIIAPLIPWSIAASVPLATTGTPLISIAAACYLYFIPLWNLLIRSKTVSRLRAKAHRA